MNMTKADLLRLLTDMATRHPVHALPVIVQIVTELVSRLPDDSDPPARRGPPHKRFVPIDLTPKEPV